MLERHSSAGVTGQNNIKHPKGSPNNELAAEEALLEPRLAYLQS